MNMSGISRLFIIAMISAGTLFCMASAQEEPDWTYKYTEDFNSNNKYLMFL